MTVAWFTIEDLGVLIRRHGINNSVSKAISRIPLEPGQQQQPSSVWIRRDHAQGFATATVDRLLRHAHVVVPQGRSYS
jgi:hypothetical protein